MYPTRPDRPTPLAAHLAALRTTAADLPPEIRAAIRELRRLIAYVRWLNMVTAQVPPVEPPLIVPAADQTL